MSDPLKLAIMDVDTKIQTDNLMEVTSTFIKEPSSPEFHPEGLFSEHIFGEIASPERISRHGWINLHTEVFHPRIYKIITRLKGFYEEIMMSRAYAIFDEKEKDFIKVDESTPKAQTGFAFFVKHFKKIEYTKSASITRSTKLEVLEKYKNNLLLSKTLVLPAGLRDFNQDDVTATVEEINKFYQSLINLAAAMPEDGSDSPIYDSVRMSIQKKIIAIYEYIKNIVDGKTGFFQKKFGARNVALATRNVITAAETNTKSPDSSALIKSDETQVPLFQAMKAFQPLVIFQLKILFFNQVFGEGSAQISVINPKTFDLGYIPVSVSEKDKFLTSDGLVSFISSYRDQHTRHLPVSVADETGKRHLLFMVYQDGDQVFIVRNIHDLKPLLEESGRKYDPTKAHAMTRAEMFYIATYYATLGKHCTVTRYPITSALSIYPSRVHVLSTTQSTEVTLRSAAQPNLAVKLPHFPVLDAASVDSTVPHPSHLANLGGDFDGDTISLSPVLSEEANKECADYLASIGSVVGVNGKLSVGLSTDICKLTLHNLTRIPTKKKAV